MPTVQQVTDAMVAQLKALDPAISAEVGTPERKIIEAVAEQIAQSSSDLEVLDSQHDLDTMTGNRLDSFLGNFGFGRQQPTRATGSVTFSRLTASTTDISIPTGTSVAARQASLGFAAITFVTTQTTVLPAGALSVDANVEASVPGSIANVPANSINGFAGPQQISGISGVANAAPITGGLDGESDAELKVRFKNTIFRNISGTNDQFLALAVSTPYVAKANVVGALSRYQEYVQIPEFDDTTPSQRNSVIDPTGLRYPHKRTLAPSTIPYSKFTYDQNFYLSNGDFGGDIVFYRPNIDYIFNNPAWLAGDALTSTDAIEARQPNLTVLDPDLSDDPTGLAPGQILLFEHAYISRNSRNDFYNGILNCVDVFVDGQNGVPVISLETMPPSGYTFSSGSADLLTATVNYRRTIDNTLPVSGNRLHVLYWQPVTDLPDTIQIGTNLYYKAQYVKYDAAGKILGYFADSSFTQPAHYWFIKEVTDVYGTIRARNGIEWSSTEPGVALDSTIDNPAGSPTVATDWVGNQFRVENYLYDQNIGDLQAIMEKNKQTTTDVLVHQSRTRYFKLYITVMYGAGANVDAVNLSIYDQIDSFFRQQYFGTVIQMSDLLQVVHNTPGVDNVRWSRDLDVTVPRVAEVQSNGTPILTVNQFDEVIPLVYDEDFFLQDSELPDLPTLTSSDVSPALVIRKRAQNTWLRVT